MKVKGKVVVVTGAGSGMGRESHWNSFDEAQPLRPSTSAPKR